MLWKINEKDIKDNSNNNNNFMLCKTNEKE
jgi:hypothetical protein